MNSNISLQPDTYTPVIDSNGNYIDSTFSLHTEGIRCRCGSRKDKVYKTNSQFSSHMKTKIHKKWLDELNLNKANFYIECEKQKQLVKEQREIIAKLENDVNVKSLTINYLTKQLCETKNNVNVDLLSFD